MKDEDHGLQLPVVVVGHRDAYFIVAMRSVKENFIWSFLMSWL